MKKLFLWVFFIVLTFSAISQNTSPLKKINFRKLSNELVDLKALKQEAGRDCDFDNNVAALIRVKAQGFSEKTMLDFIPSPRPGIEIIYKKYTDNELWLYVSSNCQGTIIIKYMGEFEFKLPNKLEQKSVYELILGVETATLTIRTVPPEAEIYIDNEKVGKGEAIKTVSIGAEHRYRVVCENYYTKEGQVYFEKREEKLINVELEPNFGFITIKTNPTGADVFVDEVKVGSTPYQTKKIPLGIHVIELRKAGCETFSRALTIEVGVENKELENVKLTAVQVPTGSLVITSNPSGAVVTINGRQYGQTPQTLTNLEIGTYIVDFSKEGYQNLSQTVTIKESKKETLAVTMSKQQQPSFENKTITVNGVSFTMVAVKGGTFTMGGTYEQGNDANDREKPTHSVTLSDYYIGSSEVTGDLWAAVMGYDPSHFHGPVEQVSWNDVQEFIRNLNQKTGINFRLPTESEWEYAARGGDMSKGYKYSGSNNIDDVAWYWADIIIDDEDIIGDIIVHEAVTRPIGAKLPNELGIYDMSGNVCEWCQDWYGDYSPDSQTNPEGPANGYARVYRGGSWGSDAAHCRVSSRDYGNPNYRSDHIGLRLAADK